MTTVSWLIIACLWLGASYAGLDRKQPDCLGCLGSILVGILLIASYVLLHTP